MAVVELEFPVLGRELPEDNGYAVYAGVSRALGGHSPRDVAVASIGGPVVGDWKIQVNSRTRLRIRCPLECVERLLSLAGNQIDVSGFVIRLGVPRIHQLRSVPALYSRLVTIKGSTEIEPFLEAAEKQLRELGVAGALGVPAVPGGPRQGLPQRRIVKVRRHAIVGFAVIVANLSEADSLVLQERGIGGRRHMGCGIFGPIPKGMSQ